MKILCEARGGESEGSGAHLVSGWPDLCDVHFSPGQNVCGNIKGRDAGGSQLSILSFIQQACTLHIRDHKPHQPVF